MSCVTNLVIKYIVRNLRVIDARYNRVSSRVYNQLQRNNTEKYSPSQKNNTIFISVFYEIIKRRSRNQNVVDIEEAYYKITF